MTATPAAHGASHASGGNDPIPGAASSVGRVCWFEQTIHAAGPGNIVIPWAATSDGVAAFTDAEIGEDATQVVVVNGGAWHFNVSIVIDAVTSSLGSSGFLVVTRGDDEIGPLYDLGPYYSAPAGVRASVTASFDIDLDDGEILTFGLHGALQADADARLSVLSGRRLGDVS